MVFLLSNERQDEHGGVPLVVGHKKHEIFAPCYWCRENSNTLGPRPVLPTIDARIEASCPFTHDEINFYVKSLWQPVYYMPCDILGSRRIPNFWPGCGIGFEGTVLVTVFARVSFLWITFEVDGLFKQV